MKLRPTTRLMIAIAFGLIGIATCSVLPGSKKNDSVDFPECHKYFNSPRDSITIRECPALGFYGDFGLLGTRYQLSVYYHPEKNIKLVTNHMMLDSFLIEKVDGQVNFTLHLPQSVRNEIDEHGMYRIPDILIIDVYTNQLKSLCIPKGVKVCGFTQGGTLNITNEWNIEMMFKDCLFDTLNTEGYGNLSLYLTDNSQINNVNICNCDYAELGAFEGSRFGDVVVESSCFCVEIDGNYRSLSTKPQGNAPRVNANLRNATQVDS